MSLIKPTIGQTYRIQNSNLLFEVTDRHISGINIRYHHGEKDLLTIRDWCLLNIEPVTHSVALQVAP